jgi:hypothetical protein
MAIDDRLQMPPSSLVSGQKLIFCRMYMYIGLAYY